jgi:hypothetical protein
MKYTIPTSNDATEILTDRVLIITGVGRSGTSILGKVIGSMSPVYYLFEPAIMKWLYDSIDPIWFRSILFEDYFLPIVQGRHLNNNPEDWTYWRDYYMENEVIAARKYLDRRDDAIAFLKLRRPLFVIKSNEFQALMPLAQGIFPGCRFIHIIRNGNDVVNSAIGRDWYTDEWCNNYMIDWAIDNGVKTPWYLDGEDVKRWPKWNAITRAACVWRHLVDSGMTFLMNKNRNGEITFYEYFIDDPEADIEDIRYDFNLEITENTRKHIDSIESFQQKIYPNIMNDIEEPERGKFIKMMEWCEYEI